MKTRILAAMCIMLWASAASAQGGRVGVYADPAGTDVEIFPTKLQLFHMYVVLDLVPSARGAEFKVSLPASFSSSTIAAGYSSPFAGVVGNPYSGVAVDFGSCLTTPILVMTLDFIATASIDCSQLHVVASPLEPTGMVTTADCSGQPLFATGGTGYVWTGTPAVVDRTPVDGATDVPTDVVLHWTESYCFEGYGDCFSQPFCSGMYFGTDSDPPYADAVASSYAPGGLQPHTTYYWWVGADHVGPTPIWSFTTGNGPVAAERSTWGGIKALYQ